MDQERLQRYFELFLELADRMNRTDIYDREVIHGILGKFADLFHLSKGVLKRVRRIRLWFERGSSHVQGPL